MQARKSRRNTQLQRCCAELELFEPRRLMSVAYPSKAAEFGALGSTLHHVLWQYNDFAAHPVAGSNVQQVIARNNPQISTIGKSVAISARPSGDADVLVSDLKSLGATHVQRYGNSVAALAPFSILGSMASLKSLAFAKPVYARLSAGSVSAQSDNAIRSVNARTTYGATGAGVKVGVISDSFNTSGDGSYSTDVATGDLPAGVQVLEDYTDLTNGTTDEGRAMAQLVYDSAPGASLAFATAYTSEAGFASNITALANAGCKVIVDDVFYLDEPFFQDGIVAQAVDNAVSNGVAYFSAAGNQARQSYDSTWRTGNVRAAGSIPAVSGLTFRGGTSFNFSTTGTDDTNSFTLGTGSSVLITLQWDDPALSAGPVGATHDLDIYILNAAGTQVLASSVDDNLESSPTGSGDPVEIVEYKNTGATAAFNVMIVRNSATNPGRVKYVEYDGAATSWQFGLTAGTIAGHANSATGAGISAARYDATPAYGITPPTREFFTSYGNVPILFDTLGLRYATAVTRQQPMVTGVDGSDTTFFGQAYDATSAPNFFGTSAAAPTVAAVAALMLQKVPTATPAQIYTAMKNTAVDMDDPVTSGFDTGFDYLTGYGLVRADNALAALTGTVSGYVMVDNNTDGLGDGGMSGVTVFNDANTNGVLDSGEASAVSNAAGFYSISGIFAGSQNIRQVVPAGYVPTNPSTANSNASVTIGGIAVNNFFDFAYIINGTGASEPYYVRGGSSLTQIWYGSVPPAAPAYSVPTSLLTSGLTINGLAGDDKLVVDYSLGNPIPTAGLTFNGGTHTAGDTLEIRGTGSSSNFGVTGTAVTFGSRNLNYSNVQTLSLLHDNFNLNGNLSGMNLSTTGIDSVVNLLTAQTLGSLSVTGGGYVKSTSTDTAQLAIDANSISINTGVLEISSNGNLSGVTKTKSLGITGDGYFNLHNNDLIVDYTGNTSSYTSIYNYVKSGLMLLGGTGSGIGSTDVDSQSPPATMLAVADNGAIGGQITWSSGAVVPASSILVKYTWFGDSNFDGSVNGSDYALIDTGFTSGGSLGGWIFGDYDYGGTVDASDYALIDTGFIQQTAVL